MARDGSGTFTRNNGTNSGATTWADDAAAAIKIKSTNHDTHDEDVATALTDSLTRNNESKPEADFVPNVDDSYDLGSATKQWAEGFFSKSVHWAKGADVASATALPLIADGNIVDVTGTTTITSFNSVGIGTVMILHFDGALILTHHATDLILPGAANITTVAGDEAVFYEYASGDWRCLNYQTVDGRDLNSLLKTKVIDIGDWNMDTTGSVSVAHGLTVGDTRSVSVLIRDDAGTVHFDFPAYAVLGSDDEQIQLQTTNVVLERATGGIFDSGGFNSTSFNRGWITIQYV